jgi:small subunit ribosomal protein S6|tara:strand:+ start:17284 stop:17607 length:324 start_codon:yes stop_codon:yes gene_type:complete
MIKKELELYELILLVKFTSTESETNDRIQRYKDFLTERGSQVMVKNQGKRSLAYPIKGFDTATSVQIVYLGNGDLVKQIGTEIQRDEFILRAITTKLMDDNLAKVFS